MSDLISRSELIENFRKCYSGHLGMENSDACMTFHGICNVINNTNTAYDVDKVVEELEERKHEICLSDDDLEHYQNGIDEAIEIVKREAEKFGTDTNVVSNGWIPCSERLPEESGYYLVTYHDWSDGNFLPKYDDTYVRRLHYQISEHFVGWNYPKNVDDRAENDCHKEVIAWQSLPEPFKERD